MPKIIYPSRNSKHINIVNRNYVWITAQGDARKIPRYNVMLFKKKDNENTEKESLEFAIVSKWNLKRLCGTSK